MRRLLLGTALVPGLVAAAVLLAALLVLARVAGS